MYSSCFLLFFSFGEESYAASLCGGGCGVRRKDGLSVRRVVREDRRWGARDFPRRRRAGPQRLGVMRICAYVGNTPRQRPGMRMWFLFFFFSSYTVGVCDHLVVFLFYDALA